MWKPLIVYNNAPTFKEWLTKSLFQAVWIHYNWFNATKHKCTYHSAFVIVLYCVCSCWQVMDTGKFSCIQSMFLWQPLMWHLQLGELMYCVCMLSRWLGVLHLFIKGIIIMQIHKEIYVNIRIIMYVKVTMQTHENDYVNTLS